MKKPIKFSLFILSVFVSASLSAIPIPAHSLKIKKSHWNWFGIWNYEWTVTDVMEGGGDGDATVFNLECGGTGQTKCHWPSQAEGSQLDDDISGFVNLTIMPDINSYKQQNQSIMSGNHTYTQVVNGSSRFYQVSWIEDSSGEIDITINYTDTY